MDRRTFLLGATGAAPAAVGSRVPRLRKAAREVVEDALAQFRDDAALREELAAIRAQIA